MPNRPAGQRPETAPRPEPNHFPNHGFGHIGGLFPTATARFGNFTMSAGFGGLLPSLLSFQFHGIPGPTAYPTASNHPFGYTPAYHGPHVRNAQDTAQGQSDSNLKLKNGFSLSLMLMLAVRFCACGYVNSALTLKLLLTLAIYRCGNSVTLM
ncbi:hypothetical protein KY284_023153 [Solanum tuberosum]|nr:hypothetical protein KY284_023153 [Solanum tuberosum]